MKKYNSRDEVPEKYKWDLTDFFKDEEEFIKSYNETEQLIDTLKNYTGCTRDSKQLYEFLEKQTLAIAQWEDLYVYSCLINDQELGNSQNITRKNKAENMYNKLCVNTSFFESELLQLTKKEYNQLYSENNKLLEYKSDLDKIYRKKEHILSENEEKLVSDLVNSMNHFSDISSALLNSEHDYGTVTLEDGTEEVIATTNYNKLMKIKNVEIRKKVYDSFNKKLEQYSATSASLLNSYVAMNNSLAKIYHFQDSWHQKLFGLNLSDKVFQTLVETTEDNVSSLHKYYELKKKILNLDILNMYDLSLELSSWDKEYSIEEAQEIVRESLKPLGEEYIKKYDKIINDRYIDYCQYKGKCSGGYSFSTLRHDSRILMSYNGNLNSISTISHESGHNVHHQFIKENNPLQYRSHSSIVAEVVSLTNECLLSDYIVKNSKTKEEKLAGLANILSVIVSNLFGAVREGKLEQDMYNEVLNGGTLTKDFLGKLAINSLEKYYGPSVKIDSNAKNSWITRSHYYMHFYLYSYAICICVASNIAEEILKGNEEMLKRYISFMKCGSDKWPTEAFQILGIDLEESKVYENTIKYFDSLINKYNELLTNKGDVNE